MSTIQERTVMVARPATYQDLVREIRAQFPRVSSVYSLAVVFQPANINGGLLQNWVEVDASAYSAVHTTSVMTQAASTYFREENPITTQFVLYLQHSSGAADPKRWRLDE